MDIGRGSICIHIMSLSSTLFLYAVSPRKTTKRIETFLYHVIKRRQHVRSNLIYRNSKLLAWEFRCQNYYIFVIGNLLLTKCKDKQRLLQRKHTQTIRIFTHFHFYGRKVTHKMLTDSVI